MRILRARRAATFVFFLVRCQCGSRFCHRAERPLIGCLHCGRVEHIGKARRPRGARLPRRPGIAIGAEPQPHRAVQRPRPAAALSACA